MEIPIKRKTKKPKKKIWSKESIIIDMKNSLDRFKGRGEQAEERIHKL